uniref:MARVEL domain-containing protein n=1 Tax=Romanomermis culicivorax TaxID=13658 RepID=A0A915IEM4_ROMCU
MPDVIYVRPKNRFLRFIEFILSILILLATNFFSLKFCTNQTICYLFYAGLTILMVTLLIFLFTSLCLHMCGGRDSPCEIWFCLLGAVTNLIFAGVWLYMMLDYFAASNRIVTVSVLVIGVVNGICFIIDFFMSRDAPQPLPT